MPPLPFPLPRSRRARAVAAVATASLVGAITLHGSAIPSATAHGPSGPIEVEQLTTEHLTDPLGIDDATPRFSWVVDAGYNGAEQTAYEIRVSSDRSRRGDVWSSGRVRSDQSHDVEYGGPSLASQTRYWWSARIWDGQRSSGWSHPAWFETAFLDSDEFGGRWIGRIDERPDEETPEVLLRKDFSLDKRVSSARLYIAGLGLHEAHINGRRVGDHELDPAYTPYDERALYVTHDVTDLIHSGENTIGVNLGRGNYSSYGDGDISDAPWLSEPELKLQLDVTYVGGGTARVESDGSWVADDGPTVLNAIKNGETYDARLEQPGWTAPDFDDTDWSPAVLTDGPSGELAAQTMEPIRVVDTLEEPTPTQVDEEATVYDFGETTAGWATVGLRGPEGAEVTIKYGEKLLADGTVDRDINQFSQGERQTYTYVLRGDPEGETYTPTYSYNGYRFVEVDAPDGVEVTGVEGKVLHSDVATTGTFSSSDELLNRYHDAMVRSTLNNFHGIPTDTPMYEKRGWTADAHIIVDNSLMNLDATGFWEKWMLDHRANQAADGGIPVIVPNELPGQPQSDPFVGRTDDPVWSASYVLVNYALYEQRGDLATLEDNWEGLAAYMDKWTTMLSATGYLFDTDQYRTWGDHEPAYGSGVNNVIVATAYVYESATKMSEIARVLGHATEADEYAAFAEQVRDAINAEYFDPETATYDWPYDASGGFGGPPSEEEIAEIDANQFQTDNLLPLELGLVPDAHRDALCDNLLEDVAVTQDSHITTGAVVLKDALPMITECGDANLAYDAATNPTFPGWGYWFLTLHGSEGAGGEDILVDTFWEAWYEGARSHDHAFRGTVDDWLYEYVAGIRTASPGYRNIQVKPHAVDGLSQASATIDSPLGEVTSAWSRRDGRMVLDVRIPVGAAAEVLVPVEPGQQVYAPRGAQRGEASDGHVSFEVGSGSYAFTVS